MMIKIEIAIVTKYSDVNNGRSSYMYDHFNILVSQVHAKIAEIS